jgi:transposase InsO family protein
MTRRKEFIAAKKKEGHHAMIQVRRVMGVSKSSWYRWMAATPKRTQHQEADAELTKLIREMWLESDRSYGWRRILNQLRLDGHRVNRKRVIRLMQEAGIASVMPRTRVHTTVSAASDVGDHVRRDFHATAPNRVWVTDITYIWTDQGWLYLAALEDLWSRKIVGWAVAPHLRTSLPLAALRMAKRNRHPEDGLIHHSDRGCQYTSDAYQKVLREAGMVSSMGRVGTCYDNAAAESFWASLKKEKLSRYRWRTRRAARRAIADYIAWYNSRRLHSTNGYLSPQAFELRPAA